MTKRTITIRQIAQHDSSSDVRLAAINKLTIETSGFELRQISEYDHNKDLRIAAQKRLNKI